MKKIPRHLLAVAVIAMALGATPTFSGANPAAPARTADPVPAGWLKIVNYYRSQAKLPKVEEKDSFSRGDRKHARYIVKAQDFTHYENALSPHYTTEGAAAGAASNITIGGLGMTRRQAVEAWIVGPFHASGILDPRLRKTGFGDFRENRPAGQIEYAAALDVIRGIGGIPDAVDFPVAFPANNKDTYIRSYRGGEYPDPLSGCGNDYAVPSGAPIILQLESFGALGSTVLKRDGVAVPHCAYDGKTYTSSDGAMQDLGRAVLIGRNAIVILPKKPLAAGSTYEVEVTAGGKTTSWSFDAKRS